MFILVPSDLSFYCTEPASLSFLCYLDSGSTGQRTEICWTREDFVDGVQSKGSSSRTLPLTSNSLNDLFTRSGVS